MHVDLSREFQVGLINGHRKASPWIGGPTCMAKPTKLIGNQTQPTSGQDHRRTREGRCQVDTIPGRSAWERPAGLQLPPFASSFLVHAGPWMPSHPMTVPKLHRPSKAINGQLLSTSKHTLKEFSLHFHFVV